MDVSCCVGNYRVIEAPRGCHSITTAYNYQAVPLGMNVILACHYNMRGLLFDMYHHTRNAVLRQVQMMSKFASVSAIYLHIPINLSFYQHAGYTDDDPSLFTRGLRSHQYISHAIKDTFPDIPLGGPLIFPTYLGQRSSYAYQDWLAKEDVPYDFTPICMRWHAGQDDLIYNTAWYYGTPWWWSRLKGKKRIIQCGRPFYRNTADEKNYRRIVRDVIRMCRERGDVDSVSIFGRDTYSHPLYDIRGTTIERLWRTV